MDQHTEEIKQRRFQRAFKRVETSAPWIGTLRQPRWFVVRLILAILLIIGGFLAILPVLGLWMIPLGLLLLAVDIPVLQGPIATFIIRVRWMWHKLR